MGKRRDAHARIKALSWPYATSRTYRKPARGGGRYSLTSYDPGIFTKSKGVSVATIVKSVFKTNRKPGSPALRTKGFWFK